MIWVILKGLISLERLGIKAVVVHATQLALCRPLNQDLNITQEKIQDLYLHSTYSNVIIWLRDAKADGQSLMDTWLNQEVLCLKNAHHI